MALAKKGLRHIQVDGRSYQWLVREDDYAGLLLVGRSASRHGATLRVTFASEAAMPTEDWSLVRTPGLLGASLAAKDGVYRSWDQERGFYLVPVPVISPRVVAAAIRRGLAAGWLPDRPGLSFWLKLGAPSTLS
jgi:hypothetical protein